MIFNRILKLMFCCTIIIFGFNSYSAQHNSYYSVKEFGAKGDGTTLDTEAIRKAVNKCAVNGGTVLFPTGNYLTGSIDLKSNVDIYIQRGATIWGSTNIKDYEERIPELKSYNDYFLKHSLFYAENAENISIRGEGIIDGQGAAYKVTTKKKPDRYFNRPFIIRFVECKNVKIEGITLQNSAMWMQQYLACEDLFIRGIKVYNHANKNNDMIDIDGCKNVVMSDCFGDTDDDALTLKSTSDRITENVSITNCVLSSHCNAIKMGTESTGGFRNIVISNIVVKPSSSPSIIYGYHKGTSGITLATVDGGVLEGINISNIRIEGTQVPIYMRLGNRGRKHHPGADQPGVGIFKDVNISNVMATDVQSKIGASITGIPGHKIQNVTLSNIKIEYPGGGTKEDAEKEIPELKDHYPESTKWGALPSYGFYLRHVNNITFSDVEIKSKISDLRPVFVCEDAENIQIHGLRAASNFEAESVLKFINSPGITISQFQSFTKTKTFISLNGERTKEIVLINNNLRKVESVYSLKDVDAKEIRMGGNIQ